MSNANDDTLLYENRVAGANFDLYASRAPAVVRADGIAGVASNGLLSTIEFFEIQGAAPDPDPALGLREKRLVVGRVQMPTASLLEGLVTLVTLMQPQLDQIAEAGRANLNALAEQIAKFKALAAQIDHD